MFIVILRQIVGKLVQKISEPGNCIDSSNTGISRDNSFTSEFGQRLNLYNRFEILTQLDQSAAEDMEDNSLVQHLGSVTIPLRGRKVVRSIIFGHSNINIVDNAYPVKSSAHAKCKQISSQFCCIPMHEIALFDGTQIYWEGIPNIIQPHKMIKKWPTKCFWPSYNNPHILSWINFFRK